MRILFTTTFLTMLLSSPVSAQTLGRDDRDDQTKLPAFENRIAHSVGQSTLRKSFITRFVNPGEPLIRPEAGVAKYGDDPLQDSQRSPSQGSSNNPSPASQNKQPSVHRKCNFVFWTSVVAGAAMIGGGTYFIVNSKHTVQPGPPPVQERNTPRLIGGIAMIGGSIPAIVLPSVLTKCD